MYHNKWILYICGYTHNVNCSNKKNIYIRGSLQSVYAVERGCVCTKHVVKT